MTLRSDQLFSASETFEIEYALGRLRDPSCLEALTRLQDKVAVGKFIASAEDVKRKLTSGHNSIKLPSQSLWSILNSSYDLIFVGELHTWFSGSEVATQTIEIIRRNPPDWIALEMFTTDQQSDLDSFISADSESLEFKLALERLIHFLHKGFSHFYQMPRPHTGYPNYDAEKMHWLRIMKECKKRKIRIIGIDFSGRALFTEAIVTYGIRNAYWARHLPTTGRGIIYAGRGHFFSDVNPDIGSAPIYLQDFFLRDKTLLLDPNKAALTPTETILYRGLTTSREFDIKQFFFDSSHRELAFFPHEPFELTKILIRHKDGLRSQDDQVISSSSDLSIATKFADTTYKSGRGFVISFLRPPNSVSVSKFIALSVGEPWYHGGLEAFSFEKESIMPSFLPSDFILNITEVIASGSRDQIAPPVKDSQVNLFAIKRWTRQADKIIEEEISPPQRLRVHPWQ